MPTVLHFIEPCLPSPADRPPSGSGWLHEIKHDGYRLKSRREARDWCKTHHPGSPVTEIGPGCKRASKKPPERPAVKTSTVT